MAFGDKRVESLPRPSPEAWRLLERLHTGLTRIVRDYRQRRLTYVVASVLAIDAFKDCVAHGLRLQAASKMEFERVMQVCANGWFERALEELEETYPVLAVPKTKRHKPRVACRKRVKKKIRKVFIPPITPIQEDETVMKAVIDDPASMDFILAARQAHGGMSKEDISGFWTTRRERVRELTRVRVRRKPHASSQDDSKPEPDDN